MKKLSLLLLLFLSFSIPCIAELSREEKLDLTKKQLKSDPSNSDLLKTAGQLSLNLGKYEEVILYADRLLKLSRNRKDSLELQAQAHILLGDAYFNYSMMREALDHLEKGKSIAEQLKNHDVLASAYIGLGIYYTHGRANPEQGIIYYNKALEHADSAHNQLKQAIALYNLGNLWLIKGNTEGIRYAREAFRKAEDLKDNEFAFHACSIMIGFSLIQKDPKEAEKWLATAKKIMESAGTEGREAYLELFEARSAVLSGDLEKADKIYRHCIENVDDLTVSMRPNLFNMYGLFLLEHNRAKESISIFERGLVEAGRNKIGSDSISLIERLAEAYHQIGDNAKAFQLMEKHKDLVNRMHARDEDLSYMEFSVKNDLQLNQLMMERQRAQLLSKERNLIVVISICLLLAVTSGLLIYYYRRKNRLFKSIIEQNRQTMERDRLIREQIEVSSSNEEEPHIKSNTPREGTGSDKGLTELADRFAILMIKERPYENPEVNVNTVAEALGTNRTYLSKAIKQTTGLSFSEVVTQYRVRRATELLSDPTEDRPLKQIAADVGFKSMSAFYAAFRNQVGMSPTQFKKNATDSSKQS